MTFPNITADQFKDIVMGLYKPELSSDKEQPSYALQNTIYCGNHWALFNAVRETGSNDEGEKTENVVVRVRILGAGKHPTAIATG